MTRVVSPRFVSTALLLAGALAGCSGGSNGTSTTPVGTQAVLSPPNGTTLPAATTGAVYSQSFTVVSGGGGPYSLTMANPPAGLALVPSGPDFALAGTPTAAGTFTPQIRVVDSHSVATFSNYTLAVQSGTSQIPITPTSLPNATVNSPYNQTLTAGAGVAPFTWTIGTGALPPGFVLNPGPNVTTQIAGSPTFSGTFVFTVNVTDSSTPPLKGSTFYSLTVN